MTTTRHALYGQNNGCQVSSGLTASGIAITGQGRFHGIMLKCDGSNDVTINVYDNTAASGTKLIPTSSVFDGTVRLMAISFSPGVFYDTGIYIEITCAGATEIMAFYNEA
jgi:hypothetical protein